MDFDGPWERLITARSQHEAAERLHRLILNAFLLKMPVPDWVPDCVMEFEREASPLNGVRR